MNTYRVYLPNGKEVIIDAEDFEISYDKKYVKFTTTEYNLVYFNFDNILGFRKEI